MSIPQSSPKVRTGVVGAGMLGTQLMEQVSNHPNMSLVAVADVDEEKLEQTGDRFGIPGKAQYTDSDILIESERLEAIIIATPHALHYEQIVPALAEDINVLCEKPLCTSISDAQELVTLADNSDGILTVGYQRRLSAPFHRVREKARADGQPDFITGEITQNWITNARGTWRSNPKLSGGGFLYDTGSHVLDSILWLMNSRPESVMANMTFDDEEGKVDDQGSINISFENGAIANLSLSAKTPRTREHIHIWNDDWGAYIDGREWADRTLTFVDEEGTEHSPDLTTRSEKTKIDAFHDAIREDAAPFVSAREAELVIAVTEAAYQSARSGRQIEVDV